jgi:hypothetical protein
MVCSSLDRTTKAVDGMNAWLVRNAGWFLIAAGIAMVLLAALLINDSAVAVALVVMGAGAVVLGALVSRAEGPLELGPSGLKISLIAKVAEKVEKQGLDRASRDRVIAGAVDELILRPGSFQLDEVTKRYYGSGKPARRMSRTERARRLERYTDELIARRKKGLPP